MVKYVIRDTFSVGMSVNLHTRTISFALPTRISSKLTDKELIIYTAEGLMHEHTHLAIYDLFNRYPNEKIDYEVDNLAALFDVIQEYFGNNKTIIRKIVMLDKDHTGFKTWDMCKKAEGFQFIFDNYHITPNNFKACKEITSRRIE